MSAKLLMHQLKSQQLTRSVNTKLEHIKDVSEDNRYEIKKLWQMMTYIQIKVAVLSSISLQLLINFWKWVIFFVSAILSSVKMYKCIQRKLKDREMKRHYARLEEIAALGLTFRHQCSEYKYDVFISSCEEDGTFVEDQLLPKIQTEWHLSKYYGEMDGPLGVDIISNLSEKIHKSRKTLVVLSQKFIQSSWSVHELCLAYHRKFFDAKDSLVILHWSDLIDNPLELEPLLQGNNYADFRKGSTEKARNKLKHALIKGRKSKQH
ncbi:toll-like receptor 6 [Ptychodera flava]|uniref:toll-like receptor 6 n=1 Tax=Ptychodera flava TaxID=63121 RepID=UPI003969E832